MTEWDQVPVAALAGFRNGYAFKPEHQGSVGRPIVRIEQFLNPDVEPARYDGDDIPRRNHLRAGDLIFSWSGTLAVGTWDREPAYLNQHLFRVDPRPGVDPRWLRWSLVEAIERMTPWMHGSAMTHITRRVLEEVRVPVPPLEVQRRIADYLDTETARIDTLINKNEHATSLVEERVERLRHARLWGRSTSPLHDSAGLSRIQYVTAERSGGKTPSRGQAAYWIEDHDSEGTLWASIGDMTAASDGWITTTEEAVTDRAVRELPLRVVRPGAVMYAMYASLGAVVRVGAPMAHNQAIISLRPSSAVSTDYLYEWLVFLRPYVLTEARSNTQANLNAEQVGRLPILLPSRGDQGRIVGSLREARDHAARTGASLSVQRDLLRERRQALITAAVTGEIEV